MATPNDRLRDEQKHWHADVDTTAIASILGMKEWLNWP